MDNQVKTESQQTTSEENKFCKHCGHLIAKDAVLCVHCGCQVEELHTPSGNQPNIVINNANTNSNANVNAISAKALKKEKNKWIALLLCFFLGVIGIHKFYEGKIGMGILYLFTAGLFGIGVLVDFFVILFKSNPYYV